MHLTLSLLRRSFMPPGHIFRGKRRLVKKVEPVALRRLREDFEQEMHNMNYLRFPYLSTEESCGHSKALGKPESRIRRLRDQARLKFMPDVTYMDALKHMRTTEGWD